MRWPRMTVRQYVMGIAILAFNIAVLGGLLETDVSRFLRDTRFWGDRGDCLLFLLLAPDLLGLSARGVVESSPVDDRGSGSFGVFFGGFFAIQNGHPWQWPGVMFGLASLVPVFSAGLGYLISRRGVLACNVVPNRCERPFRFRTENGRKGVRCPKP